MRTKQDARKQAARAEVPYKDLKARNTQNARDTKKALHDLLENIESGGSFAASGVYSEAPLPDLVLEGFGPIPLPLAERNARALCKEPTEGDKEGVPPLEKSINKKSGRLLQNQWYRKSLHNQWEMKTNKLAIRNPAWNRFVQGIAVKAAEDLGIKPYAGVVEATMDRACIWAVGACITPYKELSNVPGCFGKLLICLPAAYQGGDLLATYGGETKKFLTETYSDVTLEFRPLGMGYRLVLEYDLMVSSTVKRPSLAHLYSEKDKLRDLLAAWNYSVEKDQATQHKTFPTLLTYVCYSHYENESLSLNILQDNDRLRAACLKDLCSQIDMGLYIADLDRTRSGFFNYYLSRYGEPDSHEIDTEDEDRITLMTLIDLDGNPVADDSSIDVDEYFIQSEPFDDEVPDEKDFDHGYEYVTHIYRRTVLVLIPSVAKAEWLSDEK